MSKADSKNNGEPVLCIHTLGHVIASIRTLKLERERFADFVTLRVLDRLIDQLEDEISNVLAGMEAIANELPRGREVVDIKPEWAITDLTELADEITSFDNSNNNNNNK